MGRSSQHREEADTRVGTTLNNKWHLDYLIDVGGMAAVYAATHRNGKKVAVKVLHTAYAEDSNALQRFLREGYVANKVGHPGAVEVLDDDVTPDRQVYLVMELLAGESLEGLLARRGGTLGVPQVLAVVDQVLDVLACAHTNKIIHRDIKPGNLFLTPEGQVKVLDFGLARLREANMAAALTGAGMVMGTSAYMPPEQARAKWDLVDGRTDVFAVGAVMFRMLAGRYVHDGETANDRLFAAMTQPAPSLASVAPNVPGVVVHVADRALAFEIEQRWPTAREMQGAVRNAFAALTQPAQSQAQPATSQRDAAAPTQRTPAAAPQSTTKAQASDTIEDSQHVEVDVNLSDLTHGEVRGVKPLGEVSEILVSHMLSAEDLIED